MYIFPENPNEQDILNMEMHRHQYIIFLNAITDETLSDEDRLYFQIYLRSYMQNEEFGEYRNGKPIDADYMIGVLHYIDEKIKQSYTKLPNKLSPTTEEVVKDLQEQYKYLCLRQVAQSSIKKALEE